jgi:CBS domain-containing protein
MQIREAMTSDVRMVRPNQTIQEAAQLMARMDTGALPVAEDNRLVGMLTDRDIAVRAVAAGKSPDTPVRAVMSNEVMYCFEDEDLEDVAENMGEIKLRRLPVLSRQKQLVGIVSLGDIALANGPDCAGGALCDISEPGGAHSQTGGNGRARS